MLNLESTLNQPEIDRLKKTQDLITPLKAVNFIAQTLNSIPWAYESAVCVLAEEVRGDIGNPLKTILITSWLCRSVSQGKLTYSNPIGLAFKYTPKDY